MLSLEHWAAYPAPAWTFPSLLFCCLNLVPCFPAAAVGRQATTTPCYDRKGLLTDFPVFILVLLKPILQWWSDLPEIPVQARPPLLHSFPISLRSAGRDLLCKLGSSLVLFSLMVCMWCGADSVRLGCSETPYGPRSCKDAFLSVQEFLSCLSLGASVPAHPSLSVAPGDHCSGFCNKKSGIWALLRVKGIAAENCAEKAAVKCSAGQQRGSLPLCVRSELSWSKALGSHLSPTTLSGHIVFSLRLCACSFLPRPCRTFSVIVLPATGSHPARPLLPPPRRMGLWSASFSV